MAQPVVQRFYRKENCNMPKHTTRIPRILMPKAGTDLAKWAVIACDQYTSQPEYWEKLDREVGGAPSTLRITLPEVYLEEPDVESRIRTIHDAMGKYLADGILEELPAGIVLTARDSGGACPRKGLVMAFDLEDYDYHLGSASAIRPTEKTVEERIPPRLAVREGAAVELPHIMLLIDDPDCAVIEPLFDETDRLQKLYDIDLMENGGHLTGWFIPQGALTDQIEAGLANLADRAVFNAKYGVDGSKPVLPFAVGDGNHSMATAKASWEKIKAGLSPEEQENHPARYVLAEVVNLHDKSLEIEGIYRVLFGADADDVLSAAQTFFAANGGTAAIADAPIGDGQSFPFETADKKAYLTVRNSKWALPVATLQAFLDDYLAKHPAVKIDYIHGLDVLHSLSVQPGNLGFALPDPAKEDLFRGVIFDGVLPRKTFSMGEAREKRYYMEAKRIL